MDMIRRSIALKVLVFVGMAVSCLLLLQTYIVTSNSQQLIKPLIDKELNNALLRVQEQFVNLQQQVLADSHIIRSHNAFNNYIDYVSLNEPIGASEELAELELFLRSLVQAKPEYLTIALFVNNRAILKLENAEITLLSESTNTTANKRYKDKSTSHYYEKQQNNILLHQHTEFPPNTGEYLVDISNISVSITRNISRQIQQLASNLRDSNTQIMVYSLGNEIFSNAENTRFSSKDWLSLQSDSPVINAQITVAIKKQTAYRLINRMNNAGILLLLSLLVVMSIALYFTTRQIIGVPLKKLISFINNEVLNNHRLSNRYPITSNDEIGTFSKGLNSLLDDISGREQALIKSEQRLNTAIWGSSEGLWEFVFKEQLFYFSNTTPNSLVQRFSNAPIPVNTFRADVHPQDLDMVEHYTDEFIRHKLTQFHLEFRLRYKNTYEWVALKGRVNFNEHGQRYSVLGTLANITQEKESQEKIKLFATAFESSASSILIIDSQLNVLVVNKAFTKVTGYELKDIKGKTPHFIHHPSYSSFNIEEFRAQIQKTGNWCGELVGKRKDGSSFVKEIEIDAIVAKNQKATHYVCVFSDVTAQQQSQRDLVNMANHDALTGLPNRAYFRNQLDQSLSNAQKRGQAFAILFLDLDRFKRVNDTLGHEIGDALLKAVGELFKDSVRKDDVIARLGGDEFSIILQDISHTGVVEKICNTLLDSIATGRFFNNKETGVGLSIGIAMYPLDAENASELLHCADTAMYYSKSSGRNKLSFFNVAMSEHNDRRNLLEKELRIAIAEDTLSLRFQPQICIKTGRVVSFEALSRWYHPSLGEIRPDEFISIAEDSTLIVAVGQRALEHACIALNSLHQAGFGSLRMAVNVSPKQFLLSDIAADVAQILEQTKVPAHLLELELTESLIIDDPEKIIKTLNKLKKTGVRLSIDDFGTGYSSLSYLTKFPLDALKIDKSFIHQMDNSDKSLALTQSIIAIAHILGLEVIAEGVETEEQLRQLRSLKAEVAQGWLYSKALPMDAVITYLEHHNS